MAHLSNDNERTIIVELLEKGQLEISDFEKKLKITKSSIMRLLKNLEKDGIIEIGESEKKTAGRRKKFYRLKNVELPGMNIQDIKEFLIEEKLPKGVQSKEISAKFERMEQVSVKVKGGLAKFDPTLLVSDLILSGLDIMSAIQMLVEFEAQLVENMSSEDIYNGIVELLRKKNPTYAENYRELVRKEIQLEPSVREVWKIEDIGEMVRDQFGLKENEAKLLIFEFGRFLEFLGYYKFSYNYLMQTFYLLAKKHNMNPKRPNVGNFWIPKESNAMIVSENVNKKIFSSMLRSKGFSNTEKEEIKELRKIFGKYYKKILEKARELRILIPSEDFVYFKKINILKDGFIPDAWEARNFGNYIERKFHLDFHRSQYIGSEVFERLQHLALERIPLSLVDELCKEILTEKGMRKFERHREKPNNEYFFSFEGTFILPRSERSSALDYLVENIAERESLKQIHIHGINGWLAVPNQLQHDLRWFLVKGFKYRPVANPPGNVAELIRLILRIIDEFSSEVSLSQNFDFFNIFISPFFEDMEYEVIKRSIRLLISELDRKACNTSFGIELEIPEFLRNHSIWVAEKVQGIYNDFESESYNIAEAILEVLAEGDVAGNPYRNPKVILKLRKSSFENEKMLEIVSSFFEKHSKHIISGNPPPLIMVNCVNDPAGSNSSYFSNGQGVRLSNWEDSFGVSNLQTISLDMPTILSHKPSEDEAIKRVEDIADIIVAGLIQKIDIIKGGIEKKRFRLLSMSTGESRSYLNLGNSISTLGISQMRKALFNFRGHSLEESRDTLEFSLRLLSSIQASIDKHVEKIDYRKPLISISQANLFSSIQRNKFYEEWLPIQFSEDNIRSEERIQQLLEGGKIFYVRKPATDFRESLVRLTNSSVRLFSFVQEKKS